MADFTIHGPDDAGQLVRALSRWDNEGGAGDDGPQVDTALRPARLEPEMVALQARLAALEEVVVALLAAGTDQTMQVAQRVADQAASTGAQQTLAQLRGLMHCASRLRAGLA